MDILMVSAELSPFVDTGCGSVVAALAKGLKQLGHDVTVALPRLEGFEAGGLMLARRLSPLEWDGGQAVVFDCQLPSGVKVVLFDGAPSKGEKAVSRFEGEAPFGSDVDADLLAERCGLLVRSVQALCQERSKAGQGFDVVHLFDWPAAPAALNELGARVVLTITDATHQGSFPARAAESLGIPKERAGEARAGNRVNALKAGISGADVITTISDAYARDLSSDGHAGGLTRVLADRSDVFFGVQLGVDYAVFNPATDPSLAQRYDAEDPSGKQVCKTALLRQLEIPLSPERPLMAFAGDLTRAGGGDWLVAALPKLLANDVVLLVSDAGDDTLVTKLRSVSERYPDNLRILPSWENGANSQVEKRRLLAACDLWLISPRADRAATELMLAERYGAVPVVHAVGALGDTIVDADAELSTGTGFAFDEASPKAITAAVARAISGYQKQRWSALRRRVMRQDVSWDRPARRFQQLYRA
ncbi:MAG: glycogen/starch synthase [Polyangiaceae bacterium]|nr:glycogen/starch synthase [Polyangiaceae bacterium]